MKILLATDGSHAARSAEELVASIRWPAGTRIEVVQVDQSIGVDLAVPATQVLALRERIEGEIAEHLAAVRRALAAPDRAVETLMLSGRPASEIVAHARRSGADLVVVGNRGRGPFTSALLGSVAAEVVDQGPCPVLVARTPKLAGVVLAADDSAGSGEAERLVATWPFLRAVPVRVVSVADLMPLYGGLGGEVPLNADVYQQLVDGVGRDRERIATAAAERLRSAGATATSEVRSGFVAAELIAAAIAARADLIVIGSRGNTGLARLVLGSVARNVLFHAPCSVLVVRQKVVAQPPGDTAEESMAAPVPR